MSTVLVGIVLLLNVLILGFVTRRLLGIPVGWPRTIVVTGVVFTSIGALVQLAAVELGYVAPTGEFTPGVHPAIALGVIGLATAWVIALGVGALVVVEALIPTGTLPQPVAVLRDLPARRRRSRRYTQIVAIAVRHGLGGFLRPTARTVGEDAPQVARSLRRALTDGGVTFVKLGQMLSTRPDLIGAPFASELSKLTADAAPEPWQTVEQTLATEWGADPGQVLAEIDREPLASASVGQVHRARLHDGAHVVVKVQRTGARAQVNADLDILRRLARWLERTTGWGRALQLRSLVDGFANSLDEELDYRAEAANAAAIGAAAAGAAPAGTTPSDLDAPEPPDLAETAAASPGVRVRTPAVYAQWTSSRVMVMEQLDGQPLSRASAILTELPPTQRAAMANALLEAVLRQVLQTGTFHADLHSGNVFVDSDGSLALLDFGSVGRLDRVARAAIGRLLLAVDRSDSLAATDALLEVLDRPPELDDRRLEREVGILVVRYGGGLGHAGAAGLFAELFTLVVRHEFSVPPQIAAVFRAFGALEGTLALIEPGIDLVSSARSVGKDMLAEHLEPERVRASLEEQLAQVVPVLQRMPRRLDALTLAAQRGELSLNVRLLGHRQDRAFITGLVQQLIVTLIAGAAALGAILLVISDGGPVLAEGLRLYPTLGATLFLVAFVLAARALALAFRHDATTHWGARE